MQKIRQRIHAGMDEIYQIDTSLYGIHKYFIIWKVQPQEKK